MCAVESSSSFVFVSVNFIGMAKRVLIINKSFPAAGLTILEQNNLLTKVLPIMDHYPDAMTQVRDNIAGHHALIWNSKIPLTEELLDLAGPQLKAISTMSSGTNHLAVSSVAARGQRLGSTPQALHHTVAELTVALMIAAARRFKEGSAMIDRGDWKPGVQWLLGQNVQGSTVGVVGLGGIGQAVVARLAAFNVARFLYTGRSDKGEAKSLGVERVPLEQLLKESDFVILACPLTPETTHLINAQTLALMKKTAVLVNVARGEVVDHEALYSALTEGVIFAAGVDVTSPEPLPKDHKLHKLTNCYIVPHLGSATTSTRNEMAETAAKNVVFALRGEPMVNPIV